MTEYRVTHGKDSYFLIEVAPGERVEDRIGIIFQRLYVDGHFVRYGLWRIEGDGAETFLKSDIYRVYGDS